MKGYINEMAMKLEDDNERISNLCKLFFHQLSKKGTLIFGLGCTFLPVVDTAGVLCIFREQSNL